MHILITQKGNVLSLIIQLLCMLLFNDSCSISEDQKSQENVAALCHLTLRYLLM